MVVGDDDDGEAVVYLFDGRGSWLVRGMKIKVLKGNVKSFGFSGETALTIGKKGMFILSCECSNSYSTQTYFNPICYVQSRQQ